jgi:hypothetical protein
MIKNADGTFVDKVRNVGRPEYSVHAHVSKFAKSTVDLSLC